MPSNQEPSAPSLAMPSLVEELIQSCATLRHPGCCGWNAFDLDPGAVCKWTQIAGRETALGARKELDQFRARIKDSKVGMISHTMDCSWNPQEAAEWLETFSGFLGDAGFPESFEPTKIYPHLSNQRKYS